MYPNFDVDKSNTLFLNKLGIDVGAWFRDYKKGITSASLEIESLALPHLTLKVVEMTPPFDNITTEVYELYHDQNNQVKLNRIM